MANEHYLKKVGFLLSLIVISLKVQAQFDVIITGNVKNYNNEWKIEDMSETANLSVPTDERSFLPDSSGFFRVRFKIIEPGYYRIGRNILYVMPGDSVFANIDFEKPEAAIFHGSHAEANAYLVDTPFPMAGSFLAKDSIIKPTIEETIVEVFKAADFRKIKLSNLSNLPAHFVVLEEARIRADIINSLNDIYYEFSDVNKISKDSLPKLKLTVEKKIAPYVQNLSFGFTDPFFLKLTVYQKIVRNVVKVSQGKCCRRHIKMLSEWMHARELFDQMRQTTEKSKLIRFKNEIIKISNSNYRVKLTQSLKTLLAYGNGDTAINFIAVDSFGQRVSLAEYRGKIIYIDIWASWCGPCISAFPKLAQLRERYMSNENVVFISLSIDDNISKWKKRISELHFDGIQWVVDKSVIKRYSITGVPRTIVIDKNFRIAAFKAPMPSDNEAVKLIERLL